MADMLSELIKLQQQRGSTPLFAEPQREPGPGGSFPTPELKSPVDLSTKDLPPFDSKLPQMVPEVPVNNVGNFSPQGISSMLDLKRLGVDLQKASSGDRDARARVDYVRQNAPLVSSLTAPKPKSRIASLPAAKDLTGEGLSAATLPAGRDLSGEGMSLASLPAPKPVGGGGVEVPAQEEKSSFDRSMGLGLLGDTLINFGNAIGNPRTPTATTGWTEKFRQEQMQALKMRHDMWQDAYNQAQALPSEVLSMPEFSSLAQAKQALEKDMMDGKIDNEKNVSTFLTEQARYKGKLDELMAASKGRQAASAEEAAVTAKGNRRLELEQAARNGDQQAAAILANLGPTDQAKWDAQQERWKAEDERQRQEQEWRHEDRLSALEDRKYSRQQADQYRRDALEDRAAGRRGSYITSAFESAITRRLPDRNTLANMDPKEAEKLVSDAQRRALEEIAPRLDAAAQAAGLNIVYDVTMPKPFKVGEQYFDTKEEVTMYLLGQLGG